MGGYDEKTSLMLQFREIEIENINWNMISRQGTVVSYFLNVNDLSKTKTQTTCAFVHVNPCVKMFPESTYTCITSLDNEVLSKSPAIITLTS